MRSCSVHVSVVSVRRRVEFVGVRANCRGRFHGSFLSPPRTTRLDTSQIIALGEYLLPTFDPSKLTIRQLLGVLAYHNVKYPTKYTKTTLLAVFDAEIRQKAKVLKLERMRRERREASSAGIIDGRTGRPVEYGDKVCVYQFA